MGNGSKQSRKFILLIYAIFGCKLPKEKNKSSIMSVV